MPQSWDMGQILSLPLRRKAWGGFFRCPKKSNDFGRVWTRELGVPEASMLATRPPKPSWLHLLHACAQEFLQVFVRSILLLLYELNQERTVWFSFRENSKFQILRNFIQQLPIYSEQLQTDRRTKESTVIPRLTKIIRSGITFVSRNVISRRFL